MGIIDLKEEEIFQSAFVRWGSHYTECNCGKVHICIDSDGFSDYNPEEMYDIQKQEANDNVIFYHGIDSVEIMEIAHRQYVVGCPCEGWKPYMDFILRHRKEIREFLVSLADRAQVALEQERMFNILKSKNLNLLKF